MSYYFIGASLPPLELGLKPDMTAEEFDRLLQLNLTADDYRKVRALRRFYDIQNIPYLLKGDVIDPHGLMSKLELEEAILTRSGFPDYVNQFLEKYETTEDRILHFQELSSLFFKEEIQKATGFVKDYFTFGRSWRLVLTALRAKKLKKEITSQLSFEDPEDPFVQNIFDQAGSPEYEPPEEYKEVKTIYEKYCNSPMEMQRALLEYRFRKIDEICGLESFTLRKILGYMIKLILAEKWANLDPVKGMQFVNKELLAS